MASSFFVTNFIVFGVLTAASTVAQSYFKKQQAKEDGISSTGLSPVASTQQSGSGRSLYRSYIIVYALVMGADWLQGPYMFPLYSDAYNFTDRIVAMLFVFGFTAGGISAPYVGKWADLHGRKFMCLVFCATYATSSLIVLVPSLPILLFGRLLGGVSTSILFSCFEAWLIASAHDLGLPDAELSSILSRCTFINGMVAALSGVFSNTIVSYFDTVKAPFVASAICLGLAALAIRTTWSENYGSEGEAAHGGSVGGSKGKTADGKLMDEEARQPLVEGNGHAATTSPRAGVFQTVLKDASLMTLGITQTFYETAMYLFVFLWVPALELVAPMEEKLPFGIIFSAFMCCMSLGSAIYGIASTTGPSSESSVRRHATLAIVTCLVAAVALVTSATSYNLPVRFWAFCAFEATVGMYFPILGTLRGALIPDEARASFSAVFRVPLNVLVTISLLTGAESHKEIVIFASVAMLAMASVAMALGIRRRIA